jgi:hypothetical protein
VREAGTWKISEPWNRHLSLGGETAQGEGVDDARSIAGEFGSA